MPYFKIETNRKVPYRVQFTKSASHLLSELLNKPEKYVMISLQDEHEIRFGGSSEPAAFVQIKSIGLPENCEFLLSAVTNFIVDNLSIPKDRIYIECENLDCNRFAWNGQSFGAKNN
jgi:phenylpyruvate tautomerase